MRLELSRLTSGGDFQYLKLRKPSIVLVVDDSLPQGVAP